MFAVNILCLRFLVYKAAKKLTLKMHVCGQKKHACGEFIISNPDNTFITSPISSISSII